MPCSSRTAIILPVLLLSTLARGSEGKLLHLTEPQAEHIARYTKFFRNAYEAVTSGGIPAHAQVRFGQLKGSIVGSLGFGLGKGKITANGMDQKVVVARASAGIGPEVGANFFTYDYYFGKKGASPDKLITRGARGRTRS